MWQYSAIQRASRAWPQPDDAGCFRAVVQGPLQRVKHKRALPGGRQPSWCEGQRQEKPLSCSRAPWLLTTSTNRVHDTHWLCVYVYTRPHTHTSVCAFVCTTLSVHMYTHEGQSSGGLTVGVESQGTVPCPWPCSGQRRKLIMRTVGGRDDHHRRTRATAGQTQI